MYIGPLVCIEYKRANGVNKKNKGVKMSMHRLFALVAGIMFAVGCSQQEGTTERKDSADSVTKKARVESQTIADTVKIADPCIVLASFTRYLPDIALQTHSILHGNDSCVIELIDTLVDRFSSSGELIYIVTLDSIVNAADGYIGEYLDEVLGKMFYTQFPVLISYIYKNTRPPRRSLRDFVVGSLSLEVSNAQDKKNKRKQIESFAKLMAKRSHLGPEEMEFLRSLLLDINEDYLN